MTALLSIGELASRTGLPVRTIRFYSDEGVVPPADRTDAGYRLYGPDALARLGLVRTLRDLGLDLATIRRVLEREVDLKDVAAAHAAALEAQIRVLKVQKAVLQAVARRGSDPKEMQKMHRLAQLSDDERKRVVADFLDHIFDGLDIDPGFEQRMRSAAPELPDDPTPEQVDAWIELAELVQDGDFRDTIRRMSEQQSASRQAGEELPDMRAAAAAVSEKADPSLDPESPQAQAIVAEILPAFGEADRHALADRIAVGTDARAERYWQLLAIINGWPPVPTTVPKWEWFVAALLAD
ncbi:MerR family transcriptional regulator [Solirubrobacter soli]|uniref:MerR family transcriptional regulator n=1 Tax=Solirubrobacter soli TaxID=363832 RepID=UPI000407F18E|nr:MerR family transcriptional regulator [Solirubrobacter soli]